MSEPIRLLRELAVFPDREIKMRALLRWSRMRVMYYRTDLYTHSLHVAWIVEHLIPAAQMAFGESFDPLRVLALALVHDDHELEFGDVQSITKKAMTPEQRQRLAKKELWSIHQRAAVSPEYFGSYRYLDLLLEQHAEETVESQTVKFADKFEAFGEALHEVFAGNPLFVARYQNHLGDHDPPVTDSIQILNTFTQKFPPLVPLFETGCQLVQPCPFAHFSEITANGAPHTRASLARSTGYWPYDLWRHILLNRATGEFYEHLVTQQERHVVPLARRPAVALP